MMMKMNSFLPPIVRLYANMERISTSELRRITVLFMYLDPPNETLLEGSTQAKLEYMQGVFRIIQDNVRAPSLFFAPSHPSRPNTLNGWSERLRENGGSPEYRILDAACYLG